MISTSQASHPKDPRVPQEFPSSYDSQPEGVEQVVLAPRENNIVTKLLDDSFFLFMIIALPVVIGYLLGFPSHEPMSQNPYSQTLC